METLVATIPAEMDVGPEDLSRYMEPLVLVPEAAAVSGIDGGVRSRRFSGSKESARSRCTSGGKSLLPSEAAAEPESPQLRSPPFQRGGC